jgi:hypothetical protein
LSIGFVLAKSGWLSSHFEPDWGNMPGLRAEIRTTHIEPEEIRRN